MKKLSDGDKYSLAGLLLRGRLDLSAGRLREATQELLQARRLAPYDKEAARALAEAYMRGDHFHEAAIAYGAAGDDERSDQAQSFAGQEPYRIEGLGNAARIKLLRVDPVPVVAVRVNGGDVLYFLLDTGAGQTVIDRAVADKLKLTTFGAEPGTYAAGQAMPAVYARVSSLAVGVWVLHDVPVILKSVNGSAVSGSAGAGQRGSGGGGASYKISGVMGTELLYHFLSTIDFGAGELVLRRRIAGVTGPLRMQLAGERAAQVPFRLVGDHYMVADGTVNGVGPMPFYIDTGMDAAGYAFAAPAATLRAAKLLPEMGADAEKSEGKGEAGNTNSAKTGETAIPFAIETLTLGPVTRRNLTGAAGVFPTSVEAGTGVTIGGLISQAFLRPYAVTFDFEAATLWVVASGAGSGR